MIYLPVFNKAIAMLVYVNFETVPFPCLSNYSDYDDYRHDGPSVNTDFGQKNHKDN